MQNNNFSPIVMPNKEVDRLILCNNSSGMLDGLTIYRFCHMLRRSTGGGVESYLSNVNRLLLERNKIRIVQTYLVPEGEKPIIEVEKFGDSELVWLPSHFRIIPFEELSYFKQLLGVIRKRPVSGLKYDHQQLLSFLSKNIPSLGVFHWISEDSNIVIDHLRMNNVPFVVVNHFHNARLMNKMIRRQVCKAEAVAGVSEVEVPDFISKHFFNLSDGIDTDYFRIELASPVNNDKKPPLIFFPSRIYEEKGHLDAVRAVGMLARSGMEVVLAFAGREEDQNFVGKLKCIIKQEEIQDKVIFMGELCLEDLRNWYGASDIVILPSFSEGLPRVILEAQAMEKPVIAYDVGGTREAFMDKVSGFLLKKGDFVGLETQLRYLLKNKKHSIEMGKKGREFVVSRFSLDALSARHERFYASALKILT